MNRALAEQIMRMAEADQVARHHLLKLENDPDSTAEDREKAVAQINTVDTSNLKKAKQLFQEYGYPGKNLVGTMASHRFWIIVQHCYEEVSFQQQLMMVPAEVNQRRAKVGLEPLETYIDTCNQLYYSSLNSKSA